ncbi:MAG: IS4 family transposase [Candidatus Freyarchaeota archaeon]|nr:IS4 family transposase [Candidatus Jordarchaeia archaeon]
MCRATPPRQVRQENPLQTLHCIHGIHLRQGKKVTLRELQSMTKNRSAKMLTGMETVALSSLSDYINNLDTEALAELIKTLVEKYGKLLTGREKKLFRIFDTTWMTVTRKQFPQAVPSGGGGRNAIRMGLRVGGESLFPDLVLVHCESTSDNDIFKNLLKLVRNAQITYIFDQGFTKLSDFLDIDASGNYFITRMFPCYSYQVLKNQPIVEKKGSLKILADQEVLVGSNDNPGQGIFRRVEARTREGKELVFLTNRWDLESWEVCDTYKLRWQIEVIFRWFKQYLNLNHFIAHSINGVLAQMLLIALTHLLLLIFHRALNGSKKFSFIESERTLRNLIDEAIAGEPPPAVKLF